jgi:hypothetical protein
MCDVSIGGWAAAVCGALAVTTNPNPGDHVDDLGFRTRRWQCIRSWMYRGVMRSRLRLIMWSVVQLMVRR